ncbi:Nucleotidyltransferase domain-containing protein [Desulfonema limicola]|uniref:Nucleotidyltransferase domain-containing protein n=1 Tax=Desulfonema limicola TaxID=45656 RepID=A0A975BC94_9BACT|nr:GSU2403 family nucleotidyltransferase fold protein [Desulfonema limicola]QTA82610.1 Nucleotidyltransferase domain-containing protein [Desulfonema limicola]
MEKKYKLLSTVLKELESAGVLEKLILAGSWCQYYYRILFDEAPEIPLIRTTDIDFLVPNPPKIKKKVDVSELLNNLGFDNDFDYHTGLVKYVHPDLEIQFLTPALGRGKDSPYEIKKLNINAEGLRYMTLLQDFKFQMKHAGITIWLPEPEAFVLHKILISQKRKSQAKTDKDLQSAQSIGELCIEDEARRERLKSIFDGMPRKWKRDILGVIKLISPHIFSCLNL